MTNSPPPFRIGLVGDEKVGRSSLLRQFTDRSFSSVEEGREFGIREIQKPDGERIRVEVWDVFGFRDLRRNRKVFKPCSCYFICYDITNQESFLNTHQWRRELSRYGPSLSKQQTILVGLKSDLEGERQVSQEEGILECSSKVGSNVDEVFLSAIQLFQKSLEESMSCVDEEIQKKHGTLQRRRSQEKKPRAETPLG